MANSKGSSNIRNFMYSGKHASLPPKIPFPSVSPSYVDYVPSNVIASKAFQKPKQASGQHQRTSSETLFIEEQPSWLDDLLNEPDTHVRRGGHRRSSSDSFAYVDATNASNMDYTPQDQYRIKNMAFIPSWGSQDFSYHTDARHSSLYGELNLGKQKSRTWEPSMNIVTHSTGLHAMRENISLPNSGSSCSPPEVDGFASTNEEQDLAESAPPDPKALSENNDGHAKPSPSETDTKRAKQQFAQRSRVRKLQYIAELERNIHALQAEGSEVSAELEFLNQRNLILNMENKALKQRLENLSQEQLIKYLEQEVLEREIGRLRALHQQQHQHQWQPSSSHRRSKSRDLDSQFANLSLKHKDASSGHGPVTGPLRI